MHHSKYIFVYMHRMLHVWSTVGIAVNLTSPLISLILILWIVFCIPPIDRYPRYIFFTAPAHQIISNSQENKGKTEPWRFWPSDINIADTFGYKFRLLWLCWIGYGISIKNFPILVVEAVLLYPFHWFIKSNQIKSFNSDNTVHIKKSKKRGYRGTDRNTQWTNTYNSSTIKKRKTAKTCILQYVAPVSYTHLTLPTKRIV